MCRNGGGRKSLRANSPPTTAPSTPDAAGAVAEAAFMTGALAQQRSGGDVLLCAAVREGRSIAVGARSYLVRQHARLRDAVLPRAGALQPQPARRDIARFSRRTPVTLPALPAGSVATYGAPPRPPIRSGPAARAVCCGRMDRQAARSCCSWPNPYAEERAATVALGAQATLQPRARSRARLDDPDDVNSFEAPATVVPREENLNVGGSELSYRFPAQFLHRARLKMAQ